MKSPIEDKHEVKQRKKEMQITQKKNKDYQKTGGNVEPNCNKRNANQDTIMEYDFSLMEIAKSSMEALNHTKCFQIEDEVKK